MVKIGKRKRRKKLKEVVGAGVGCAWSYHAVLIWSGVSLWK
jgi:hypothetical protein